MPPLHISLKVSDSTKNYNIYKKFPLALWSQPQKRGDKRNVKRTRHAHAVPPLCLKELPPTEVHLGQVQLPRQAEQEV